MRRLQAIVAVAAVMLLAPAAASAETTQFRDVVWFDVVAGTTIRCGDYEQINYEGQFHVLRHTVRAEDGLFTFNFTQTILLEGVGVQSGDVYKIRGVVSSRETADFSDPSRAYVLSAVNHLGIINVTRGESYIATLVTRFTLHPDGTYTAAFDLYDSRCVG